MISAYISKNVEVLSVAAGLRRVSLIEAPEELLREYLVFFNDYGIAHIAVTQDQFHQKRLKYGMRPSGDRKPNSIFLYIGKNIEDAERLYYLDAHDDSVEMGRILGYPDCCVKYFQDMKKDRKAFPSWKRYFNYVSHEPCSRNCERSLEIEAAIANLLENGGDIRPGSSVKASDNNMIRGAI